MSRIRQGLNLAPSAHEICECAHAARDHEKICLVAACPCVSFKQRLADAASQDRKQQRFVDGAFDWNEFGGWIV